jgi:hypothetical protein
MLLTLQVRRDPERDSAIAKIAVLVAPEQIEVVETEVAASDEIAMIAVIEVLHEVVH